MSLIVIDNDPKGVAKLKLENREGNRGFYFVQINLYRFFEQCEHPVLLFQEPVDCSSSERRICRIFTPEGFNLTAPFFGSIDVAK